MRTRPDPPPDDDPDAEPAPRRLTCAHGTPWLRCLRGPCRRCRAETERLVRAHRQPRLFEE